MKNMLVGMVIGSLAAFGALALADAALPKKRAPERQIVIKLSSGRTFVGPSVELTDAEVKEYKAAFKIK